MAPTLLFPLPQLFTLSNETSYVAIIFFFYKVCQQMWKFISSPLFHNLSKSLASITEYYWKNTLTLCFSNSISKWIPPKFFMAFNLFFFSLEHFQPGATSLLTLSFCLAKVSFDCALVFQQRWIICLMRAISCANLLFNYF